MRSSWCSRPFALFVHDSVNLSAPLSPALLLTSSIVPSTRSLAPLRNCLATPEPKPSCGLGAPGILSSAPTVPVRLPALLGSMVSLSPDPGVFGYHSL
ncbi:Uncharacterised protein [Mycobacteroides abscessus subsp. abscessus]|nr:Uncharacterised protein [Mycobacteroides abscessus subsp. abscessus]